eukprot:gene34625-44763_t
MSYFVPTLNMNMGLGTIKKNIGAVGGAVGAVGGAMGASLHQLSATAVAVGQTSQYIYSGTDDKEKKKEKEKTKKEKAKKAKKKSKSKKKKQFKTGEDLYSFLGQLQKRGLEKMLEGELDAHLGYEKHEKTTTPNARNGFSNKKIKTSFGESEIQVPRDRDASFNPIIVPKRQNMLDGLENVIVSLYAKGMSNSDIEEQIREVYNFEVSTSTISRITDSVSNDIVAWQNRPLEPVYLIVWMDGIVFKVRENSKVVNKTIYLAVGLNRDGKKEVLGMWLGKNESASFWLGVMTDLKARGVEDILITATDNLNGFTQTIKNVFPESQTQICVVHQIRNSARYVVWKDKKAFSADMKLIYNAPTKQAAKASLEDFAVKWNDKYPYAMMLF